MRFNLFGSKRKGDIAGVDDDTAIFLFDEDRRKLMGPWVSIKEGELEPAAFRGSLPYQVGHTSSEAFHSDLWAHWTSACQNAGCTRRQGNLASTPVHHASSSVRPAGSHHRCDILCMRQQS